MYVGYRLRLPVDIHGQCRDDGFHHYYFRVRHFFGRAPPLLNATFSFKWSIDTELGTKDDLKALVRACVYEPEAMNNLLGVRIH